jgi:MFS family permease
MIVALDGTVLIIAQPAMQRDLHASLTQAQWTSTGYLIAVASLLVFTGRLGDRYGHRPVFAVGMLGFAATSAGIGLAPGIGWVIGLRVAQGIAGALLQPATLGMLRSAYPPDRLAAPIAARTSAIGIATAVGPLAGGALVTHLGWRAVFFLNVVPALLIGLLALAFGAKDRATGGRARLDLPGAGLLAVALACLVHTLVETPERGMTASTALGLLIAAAAGGALLWHERRTPSPLVPAGVLRAAPVVGALTMLICASAAMFGTLFLASYLLQNVLELDALRSGLTALPLPAAMVVAAPICAVLLRRQSARTTAAAGAALLSTGILLVSTADGTASPVTVGACFLLVGVGFTAVMVTASAVIVRYPPAESAGAVGGLQQTAMNIGPLLGVAAATMLTNLAIPPNATTWSAASFPAGMRPALAVLAIVAAAGVFPALRLAETRLRVGARRHGGRRPPGCARPGSDRRNATRTRQGSDRAS